MSNFCVCIFFLRCWTQHIFVFTEGSQLITFAKIVLELERTNRTWALTFRSIQSPVYPTQEALLYD